MSDLISRKATLKHIEKVRQSAQMMDDTHRASILMNGMYLCEKAVRNQPSAQPEIIYCRDCKWHRFDKDNIPYCYNIDYGYGWKDDDFCSRAERREGNE